MANHYFDTIVTTTGPVVDGAIIYVTQDTDNGSVGPFVAIYSDDGVTPIDQVLNPIRTDDKGFFEFWTDETSVTITVQYGGLEFKQVGQVPTLGEGFVGSFKDLVEQVDSVGGLVDQAEAAAEEANADAAIAQSAATEAQNYGNATIRPGYVAADAETWTAGTYVQVLSIDTGTHASKAGDFGASGGNTPNSGLFREDATLGLIRVGNNASQDAKVFSDAAAASAASAATQAGIATTQAGIATTQAGLAASAAAGQGTDAVRKAERPDANIFDKSLITASRLINATTGALFTQAGYYTSSLVRVVPNGTVTFSGQVGFSSGTTYGVCFFQADGTTPVTPGAGTTPANTPISVPASAVYMRFCANNSTLESMHVVHGSSPATSFHSFNLLDEFAAYSAFSKRAADKFSHIENLFSIPDASLGSIIGSNGVVSANAGWNTTGFMLVEEGSSYVASVGAGSAGTGIIWFAADKATVVGTPNLNHVAGTPYTAPIGAAYARVGFLGGTYIGVPRYLTFTFAKGSTTPALAGFGYSDPQQVATQSNRALRNKSKLENLFRQRDATPNFLVGSTTGAYGYNVSFGTSDFFPVYPGQQLYPNISCQAGSAATAVAYYDRDRNRIASGVVSAAFCTTTSGSNTITLTTLGSSMPLPGVPVTCPNFPAGTTVVSGPIGYGLGDYVLSANATASGTGVAISGGGYLANVPLTVPPGAHYCRVPYGVNTDYVLEITDQPRVATDVCVSWDDLEYAKPWSGKPMSIFGDSILAASAAGGASATFPYGICQSTIKHALQCNLLFPDAVSGRKMAAALNGNGSNGSRVQAEFDNTGTTLTANTTTGSNVVSITAIASGRVLPGAAISGAGIPSGAVILGPLDAGSSAAPVDVSIGYPDGTPLLATATATGVSLTHVSPFANGGLVYIGLGTNDFGAWLSPNYITPRTIGALGDNLASNTFYGDMAYVTETLLTWQPRLRIAMATPLRRFEDLNNSAPFSGNPANTNGVRLQAFADAIIAHCEFYGLDCLDLFRRGGLNAKTYPTQLNAPSSNEPLHPRAEHYRLRYVRTITKWLDNLQ